MSPHQVFSNSGFVKNIENFGSAMYFPKKTYHIIGGSAFPIRPWLMTPYKQTPRFGIVERNHNNALSADRVAVENIFGIIKGRWRRLRYVNTYSICKSIEITTAACVLHNYCYLNNDEWDGEVFEEKRFLEIEGPDNREETRLGKLKRDRIARSLNTSIVFFGTTAVSILFPLYQPERNQLLLFYVFCQRRNCIGLIKSSNLYF